MLTKRMVIAVGAFGGCFLATYLTLYKLGFIGELACGAGQCEVVNASEWSTLGGYPVAAWGCAFYGLMFGIAFVSEHIDINQHGERIASVLLVAIAGGGFLFSLRLTYLEVYVIHAVCRYCIASATLVALLLLLAVWDLLQRRHSTGPQSVEMR